MPYILCIITPNICCTVTVRV